MVVLAADFMRIVGDFSDFTFFVSVFESSVKPILSSVVGSCTMSVIKFSYVSIHYILDNNFE